MRTLTLTFIGVLLVVTLSAAQATQPAAPAPAAAPKAPAEQAPSAVEPQGFTYNPEGRRDPFVSLLRRGSDASTSGPKAAGLAGLGTAEVSLRGTLVSRGAYVGILQGVDSKNYIVRAGDKLLDGTIRSIAADSMVIVQTEEAK